MPHAVELHWMDQPGREVVLVDVWVWVHLVVHRRPLNRCGRWLGVFTGLQIGYSVFSLEGTGRNKRLGVKFLVVWLLLRIVFVSRLDFLTLLPALDKAQSGFVVPGKVGMEEALGIDSPFDLLKAIHIELNEIGRYLADEAFNFPVAEACW